MRAKGPNEVVHSGRHTIISRRLHLPPPATKSDYLTGVLHANSTLKILDTPKKKYNK